MEKFNIFCVFEDVDKKLDPMHIVCGTFVFYILYMLTSKTPLDYRLHTEWAITVFDWNRITESIRALPYPMWHIIVNLANNRLHIPPINAAALTSAAFYTFEYCIIRKIILSKNKEIKRHYVDLLSCTFMFLQPFYIPWFNSHQYLGQGTPNIWHNPTIVSCYPFALICTYLFSEILRKYYDGEEINKLDCIRLSIYLFLSIIAKPAFFQIFAPAMVFLCIALFIKTRGWGLILHMFLSCILPGLWTAFIFVLSFVDSETSQGNSMGFGFLEVWKLYSPNILVSFLIATAFPLSYIIFIWVNRNKRGMINDKSLFTVSVMCFLSGLLESSVLKETGSRMAHGNFMWGYNLGLTLIYLWAVIDLIPHLLEKKKPERALSVPIVMYVLHFLFGIHYYFELFAQHITL